MLRAVCFDLMDTVVRDPYREAMIAATGADLETIAPWRDPHCWSEFEIAAIDEGEFARRFFADPDCGHRFDLDAFNRVRRAGYEWLPGMPDLLCSLAGRVKRYVASNYPVWVEDVARSFGFDGFFEGVYASHHLGVRKPDARFYRALLARVRHAPGECLFVDDRRVNCEAAEAVGMRAHRFDGVDGLRARLRAEGIDV